MNPLLYQELVLRVRHVIHYMIPPLDERVPITWQTAPYPLAYYTPFLFMAYLARRQNTYILRLLLLPLVLYGIVASAYGFMWTVPQLNVYNWGQCLLAAATIAKSLEYAFAKEGMLKLGETRPGEMKGKEKDHNANGSVCSVDEMRRLSLIPSGLYDAIELVHTMRGLKWKFGRGLHIPEFTRPLQRGPFLRATLWSFIRNYLLLDLLESLLKVFPGVGSPNGGTIFYPSLQPFWRYSVSTVIHLLTGSAILSGFGMVYDLVTLIAVGCFGGSPTSWPPVTDHPWSSESMHSLWAKRWHQLLRQTFLVLGGYPGQWLAGDLGMLFGTFIASGLFHECSIYSMGRGFDHTVSLFFTLQGPVLLLERLWRKVTGRRVGGWIGRLWVYFIMFICAQPVSDSWHRRGLGGGMVIPPRLSPVKSLLVPTIQTYLRSI